MKKLFHMLRDVYDIIIFIYFPFCFFEKFNFDKKSKIFEKKRKAKNAEEEKLFKNIISNKVEVFDKKRC